MDAIIMNSKDNVAVVLRAIASNESMQVGDDVITTIERIPYGHKVARFKITEGSFILKYGMPIGRATSDITMGGHVHVHNVMSNYMDNDEDHYE